MEKYGFIYIWYDCKRKMYYIGSHYGTEVDGYICSSNRMRDAYRRRSQDFKRRIIKNKIDRSNLLEEEHKWLQLIPDDELGKKYYNLRKHKWGHWSTDEKTKLSIKEKIIKKLSDPEIRKKISESNKGKKLTEETINKINTGEDFITEFYTMINNKISELIAVSHLTQEQLKQESYSEVYARLKATEVLKQHGVVGRYEPLSNGSGRTHKIKTSILKREILFDTKDLEDKILIERKETKDNNLKKITQMLGNP